MKSKRVTIKITIKGLGSLRRRARKSFGRMRRLDIAHKKISIFLDKWTKENFKTEGRKLSTGKWKPFALGGRRRKGGGIDTTAKLLQDSGRLRLSVIPFYNKRNAGIGSELKYAKPHNEGAKNLPQRRILPKQREVEKDIKAIFKNHVDAARKEFNG